MTPPSAPARPARRARRAVMLVACGLAVWASFATTHFAADWDAGGHLLAGGLSSVVAALLLCLTVVLRVFAYVVAPVIAASVLTGVAVARFTRTAPRRPTLSSRGAIER